MKNINLSYGSKTYTLTFNRKTAQAYEVMGFSPADIITKPNSAVIPFVFCAFKANHPTITQNKVEDIYKQIPAAQKTAFLNALTQMYTDTYTELLGDENAEDGGEGNVKWEADWSDEF